MLRSVFKDLSKILVGVSSSGCDPISTVIVSMGSELPGLLGRVTIVGQSGKGLVMALYGRTTSP